MSVSFTNSNEYLQRSLKVIPLASQTFSKSIVHFPKGASPLFAEKAEGAYLYDIDGNKYLDFISALLCINLGYKDKDVDQAVKDQLEKGTIFSLADRIETEVAELLIDMIPSAEMVRFGKNGSDATSAAIRLSRAYTKKEKIAVCGYHGWQDWYIGSTTRDMGVPKSTKDLTFPFEYNNIGSLKKIFQEHKGEIAAVIMEPMNIDFPEENFLEEVKKITHENRSVLIFDEMITGFRYSNGGAQELFGVTPDLSCFGKGIANGYPLSAIVGKKEIMTLMEDIFFSGTFGGETLSLAAAKAVLTKLKKRPVVQTIRENGEYLLERLNSLIEKYEVSNIFSTSGHPAWSFLLVKDTDSVTSYQIKTLLMQTMHENNLLCFGTHNLTYSHTKEHIDELLAGYEKLFVTVKEHQNSKSFSSLLKGDELKPLFKVR